MAAKPISLLWLALPVFICLWTSQVHAARWQDHRTAALRAVEQADYAKAIEQFGAAIYYAQKLPAADRDIAGLWENLTAVYLADAQLDRAWASIGHWNKVLVANAGQPWVAEQQSLLDRMTRILFKETRMVGGEGAGEETPTGDLSPETGLKPAESPSLALAPAEGQAPNGAQPTVGPGAYGIHLASYGSEANARQGWAVLQARYPDLLEDKTFALRPVDLGDRGVFVRLIAVPFPDSPSAGTACRDLQHRAQYCAVVPPG